MSELTDVMQRGTSQVAEATRGLATLRASRRREKIAARAQLGESLKEVGATIRAHKTWEAAKREEDEIAAIENADALSMGDPQKRLIALGAVHVSGPKAAAYLGAKKRDATDEEYGRQDRELRKAQLFSAKETRWEARAREKRADELAFKKYEEDRRDKFNAELDTHADRLFEDRKQTEYERHNRAMEGARALPKSDPYETALDPDEEARFRAWKTQYAPNDSGIDYDLRGAFQAGLVPGEDGHWPDTFKKPNHPTFSNESKYAVGSNIAKAGHWDANGQYVPPPSRRQDPAKGLDLLKKQRDVNDYEPPWVKDARVSWERADAKLTQNEKPPTGLDFQDAERATWVQGMRDDVAAKETAYKSARAQFEFSKALSKEGQAEFLNLPPEKRKAYMDEWNK